MRYGIFGNTGRCRRSIRTIEAAAALNMCEVLCMRLRLACLCIYVKIALNNYNYELIRLRII